MFFKNYATSKVSPRPRPPIIPILTVLPCQSEEGWRPKQLSTEPNFGFWSVTRPHHSLKTRSTLNFKKTILQKSCPCAGIYITFFGHFQTVDGFFDTWKSEYVRMNKTFWSILSKVDGHRKNNLNILIKTS